MKAARLFGFLITILTGDDHKRQRKVLLPGFGGPESKAFLGVFKECAETVSPALVCLLVLPAV